MNKIIITILISVFLTLNVNADTDGDNKLSKQDSTNVKDCFEGINRGIFAFNKGLDNVIFEPVAKVYRKLPSPIKIGTGNVVSNLSNLDSSGGYSASSYTWTVSPNGSEKIMKASQLTLDASTQNFELYYTDATNGWVIN